MDFPYLWSAYLYYIIAISISMQRQPPVAMDVIHAYVARGNTTTDDRTGISVLASLDVMNGWSTSYGSLFHRKFSSIAILYICNTMSTLASTVQVYYWPMLGRSGAVVRMLEHSGTPYEHISEFSEIAKRGSAFGGDAADTFAPPIVVDGDFQISQSTAVTLYIGNKVGLNEGLNQSKAVQWLGDIVDAFEGGLAKTIAEGPAALKKYLEGEGDGKPSRFAKQMNNLSRAIKGPFFAGEKPTLVDFFLCQHVDWQDALTLNRLREDTGVDIFAPYPKIVSVYEGIRNLDSYKNYAGPLKTDRPGFAPKDEFFAEYKNL